MAQVLHLPTGYFAWSMKFTGPPAPTGAAITGCGIKAGQQPVDVVAGTLRNAFVSRILPFAPSTLTLESVYVRFGLDGGTGPSFTDVANVTGASSSAPASPGVAYLIRLSTALGGRRGRGRWYLPGVLEPQVDAGGNVLGTFISSVDAALALYLSDMSNSSLPLAIGHRYPSGAAVTPQVPTVITQAKIDARLASQRKRQRR